ncbi:Uncharacterized protein C57A7.05 [Grifola frondosa]|uniref:Uncharacterized protein C57A7.05 n=1 Tax=Grifola frondosa TaxID=5627 RepID=A0A1C7MNX4_GRIFR|nr:Uncharacterized protein C57A7.05 [Grifola frondosa]
METGRSYDPRIGDEASDREQDELPRGRQPRREKRHHKHVRMQEDLQNGNGSSTSRHATLVAEKMEELRKEKPPPLRTFGSKLTDWLPFNFQWIPANFTWSKLKPTIRCAIVGWVSVVFMIIPRTGQLMGQFPHPHRPVERCDSDSLFKLLLIRAAFLDVPSDPFIAVLERELIFLGLVTTSWAWCCLGIFLASLARTTTDRNASLQAISTGQFVEAGPTVIMGVFIFLGSALLLYTKARLGPGPFLFATVFGCICIDISMTTAILFPYPFYQIGHAIALPLSFHSALCIFFSAVLFPSTITARYTRSLFNVFDPLNAFLEQHRAILKTDPSSAAFATAVTNINSLVAKSEGGLGPAAASLRLMKHDIVFGRFSPTDIGALQTWTRRLVTRANGMGIFFTLIEPTREKFPVTPVPSRPTTPAPSRPVTPRPSRPNTPRPSRPSTPGPSSPTSPGWNTPANSRPSSPDRGRHPGFMEDPDQIARRRRPKPNRSSLRKSLSRHLHLRLQQHEEEEQNNHLHLALLSLAHSLSLSRVATTASSAETAVGVFESQRYLAFESTRLSPRFVALLSESCDELLGCTADVLKDVQAWFGEVRRDSFNSRAKIEKEREERLAKLEGLRDKMAEVMERFKKQKRHMVLDPFRSAFDPSHVRSSYGIIEPPPHRYLFHCYVYQYHLIRFSSILTDILEEIIRLEKGFPKAKLWRPRLPIRKLLVWSRWDAAEDMDRIDDEDPDVIPGMQPEWNEDLGMTSRRDPDALPPSNLFQLVMYWIYLALMGLMGGNALFAIKAGFMGQLTIARFRGDTTFGLVARILSTFLGGSMVLSYGNRRVLLCFYLEHSWFPAPYRYISTGSGKGSYYGLAAVCAVTFPIFFYGRLYWPGPPMTNAIFFVTTALVIGYSWQDNHSVLPFHYYGFNLAWRRFVLVVCGVTAAFLFSFLPPSTTLRRYQRTMMSTTVTELGAVYCSIVSFANTREHQEVNRGEIVQSLVAIRMKLKRSLVLKANVIYEFSLRGRWPAERYHKILGIQMYVVSNVSKNFADYAPREIAYLLSHLMSVAEHLEPAWSRAFLRRTRLLDSDFQGDVLAVISMVSTALRTGNPLPQITPCPLLDRFMIFTHGLNVIRQEADDDYGLPRTMTIDTLENEQYLCFCVGVTTAFGIVLRLDKLMLATKELVGEQYHIHGIGVPLNSLRPAKDA